MERVVGIVDDVQRARVPEERDDRPQQREVGELVARALHEQHRHVHVGEVRRRA